jgi:hypothetical protein
MPMMKKKYIIFSILVIFAASVFAQSASDFDCAEDDFGLWIIGYLGKAAKVTIPKQIEGTQVKAINGMAFFGNKAITALVIPEGVEVIGDGIEEETEDGFYVWGAFEQCANLSSVTLPKTLVYIGIAAFCDCTSLVTIKIPPNVKHIGSQAFRRTSLKSIVIPKSAEIIDLAAFYECKSLSSVKLENGVRVIWTGAFADCTALKEISLPASIEEIGSEAFSGCTSLTTVKIPSSVKNLSIGEEAFKDCPLNAASIALLKRYGYNHQ